MRIQLNPSNVRDYAMFLKIKALPRYQFVGRTAIFPDEYAARVGLAPPCDAQIAYVPSPFLFDYQAAISALAIRKRKYCVFAECGLGKTNIILEFAHHVAAENPTGKVLIVSPLMVVKQTIEEADRFYHDRSIIQLRSRELAAWLADPGAHGIGITNYEAITDDLPRASLSALILDESSMLKSHYGAWGTRLIDMGRGVPYKLALTGTPAPNDRIEFANHAVFMDAYPTVNSFLARFFVNRGQTAERWELKAHALHDFYIALSHWCIFLTNPATYGWKDNCGTIPPMHVHIENVRLTSAQRDAFMDDHGSLFVNEVGGIGSRGKIARIGKGIHNGQKIDSNKTKHIVDRVNGWIDKESTIIWCKYNAEQDDIAAAFPGCGNIDGATPLEERERIVSEFKAGKIRVMVSKPKILGFGLNLQVCTRQVFSGLQDSYEEFHQAVKRSNRVGSTKPLHIHIPVTELEAPMVETVLSKAGRVQKDTEEQERIFHDHAHAN